MNRKGPVSYTHLDVYKRQVIYLPDEGITGNSHFMFQELNSEEIADHLAAWMDEKGLN